MRLHKKCLAFFTAAVIACTPVAASAATFADMNNVPWAGAETAINKAADLGLMVGSQENGRTYFRPKDSVSLCEMAQLSYKLMTNTGRISGASTAIVDKWVPTMQQMQIPTWAHTAISHCLEMNIVSTADLANFMRGGAAAPANREQAAAMLGRTLAVSVPSLAGTATTTFKDDYQISTNAKPYIALLVKQGVVKGDTEGNFNPQKALNRTETAVMVTNLHNVLSSNHSATATPSTSRTVSGNISYADYRSVAIKGDSNHYNYGASTVLERNKHTASISELATLFQKGEVITATLNVTADNYIQKISFVTEDDQETVVKGTVKSLSNTAIKLDSKTYTIRDYSDLTIKLDGSSKTFTKLKDEVKNGNTTVTATVTVDYNGYVTKIDAKTKSSTSEVTGTVYSMSSSKIEVGNKTYYLSAADDITVKVDGSKSTLKSLRNTVDDVNVTVKATITYDEDKYVQKIVATTTDLSSHVYNGNVTSLSKSSLKMNGKTYSIESGAYVNVNIYEDGYYADRATSVSQLVKYADGGMEGFEASIEVRGGKVMSIEGNMDIGGAKVIQGTVKSVSTSSLKINGTTYDVLSSAYVNVDIYEGGDYIDTVSSVKNLAKYGSDMIGFDALVEIRGGKVMSIEGNMDIQGEKHVQGSVSKLSSSSIKIGGTVYNIDSHADMYVYIWNDTMGTYEETTSLSALEQMYPYSTSFYAEATISQGRVSYLIGEMTIQMEVYG